MTISEQIKVLCVRCGVSEAELARRLGKSPQSFNSKMKRESFTVEDLDPNLPNKLYTCHIDYV